MPLGCSAPARVFLARCKEVVPCSVTANADIYVCSSRKAKQHTVLFCEYLARPSTPVLCENTKKRRQISSVSAFWCTQQKLCLWRRASVNSGYPLFSLRESFIPYLYFRTQTARSRLRLHHQLLFVFLSHTNKKESRFTALFFVGALNRS